MNNPVYIIGDVHGKFASLVRVVNKLKDCTLICVGDLGMGFQYTREGEIAGLERLSRVFAKRNVTFLSIRGNHDDPAFFQGDALFSNIKLLPDYTKLEINGQKWLLIGGAISIDRKLRKEGVTYWPDEKVVYRPELIEETDVIVTHTGPNWIGPDFSADIVQDYARNDKNLLPDLVEERNTMDKIYAAASPKWAYLGHFHISDVGNFGGCSARILEELEVKEHYHPF